MSTNPSPASPLAAADTPLLALLAAGSHDLRGPVHHIQAYVRLLQDDHAQLPPDRLDFMLARLLRAADTVAAELNSLTLWAKAQQGALADLGGEPETLDQVLDEYRQSPLLTVVLQAPLQGGRACPGLLFRLVLAQLAALAAEIGRGPLPTVLARQEGTDARDACWVFTWQAPTDEDAPAGAGASGASARLQLHRAALGHLATAVGGHLLSEVAPEGGVSRYRLAVPAG